MRITNYDQQPTGSWKVAIFDIEFEKGENVQVTAFRRLLLTKNKFGAYRLSGPNFKKEGSEEKYPWKPYIEFDPEWCKRVIELLQPFLR